MKTDEPSWIENALNHAIETQNRLWVPKNNAFIRVWNEEHKDSTIELDCAFIKVAAEQILKHDLITSGKTYLFVHGFLLLSYGYGSIIFFLESKMQTEAKWYAVAAIMGTWALSAFIWSLVRMYSNRMIENFKERVDRVEKFSRELQLHRLR